MRSLFRLLARVGFGIDDRAAGEGGRPVQVAALPFELDAGGEPRFLLITSRSAGRWIIPKGWPVRGLTLVESAAREAYEEAGVRGTVGTRELARLAAAAKPGRNGASAGWPVIVFPLRAETTLERWPEQAQRRRRWMTRAEAVEATGDSDLGRLIAAVGSGELIAAH